MTQAERFEQYVTWLQKRIPIHKVHGMPKSKTQGLAVVVTIHVKRSNPNLEKWHRLIDVNVSDKFFVSHTQLVVSKDGDTSVQFILRRNLSK
jgi:hypothetical protein